MKNFFTERVVSTGTICPEPWYYPCVQKMHEFGTWGHGLVLGLIVFGLMDSMILEGFSSLSDSLILLPLGQCGHLQRLPR